MIKLCPAYLPRRKLGTAYNVGVVYLLLRTLWSLNKCRAVFLLPIKYHFSLTVRLRIMWKCCERWQGISSRPPPRPVRRPGPGCSVRYPAGANQSRNCIPNYLPTVELVVSRGVQRVRCEAVFSPTFSTIPFSPTFVATPNFEVPKPWWMMDFRMIL